MHILVQSFYHKNNRGDDLFREAFQSLFSQYKFSFVDRIEKHNLTDIDAVFFGGGSMLEGIEIESDAIELLRSKPIFYIGVGAETDIHPLHQELMTAAKLIAIRTPAHKDKILAINKNTIVIPDLVYSLGTETKINRIPKSILFLPNVSVVPTWADPHWMHYTYANAKNEIAQTFDYLIENDYMLRMFPMCQNEQLDDIWAATEIIAAMKNRGSNYIVRNYSGIKELKALFNDFELIITQRFHGSIIAELTMSPFIAIAHHNKLKSTYKNHGTFLSYYELSKQSLINAINSSQKQLVSVINPDIFKGLQTQINQILESICAMRE